MSSETSLLNNSASPVLGYDLEVALNKLKKELDLTDIEGLIKKLNGRVEIVEENIEQLLERVTALDGSVNDLVERVSAFEENFNKLSDSLNALDDRVSALEGGS